ncbi:MAG: NUDIX domain-containing protein [Jatrophihabitans sp.]
MAAHDGDGWTTCAAGHRHWGRYGAAGLLLGDADRVVLQHRAPWTHEGDTWGLPGGARDSHEDAVTGALREAMEEGGIPARACLPVALFVEDHVGWSYTTVVASLAGEGPAFAPSALNRESTDIRWWTRSEVPALPLHHALARHWPVLGQPVMPLDVIVDAANVVGARPDGWWRDRVVATQRLLDALTDLARVGIAPNQLRPNAVRAPFDRVLPHITLVVEGAARDINSVTAQGGWPPTVTVLHASSSGDDTVTATAERSPHALVVTADRGLRDRLSDTTETAGPGWMWGMLDELSQDPARS